jgi:hypothetical protein
MGFRALTARKHTMATLENATEAAIDDARAKAEIAIEKILRDLEHDTMRKVYAVDIDTMNFPTPDVEIIFRDEAP